MKYTIFDTPDDVTKRISALKKAGIAAIMRYDDPSGNANSWKQIGGPKYNSILAAGIAVAIISEWVNNHVGYFNAAAGKRDADYSLHRAQQRNQPQGSAIYGVVDFDAAPAHIARIAALLQGIRPRAPCCRIQGRLLRFEIYQRKTQSRRTDRLL